MVEHHIHPQELHHFIKAFGSGAFEPGVGVPLVPHTVYHVAAFPELLYKLVQSVDVILEVGVHGDGGVAPGHGAHQPAQQGVLMAPVVGQLDPFHPGVFPVKLGNQLPGLVLAAVVHKQDAACFADEAGLLHG